MTAPVTLASAARDAAEARRILWLAFWTMLASIGVGLPWDTAWHVSRPFDSVFSPPHLFVYATTALTIAFYLCLLVRPRIRAAFGYGFAVPVVPYAVPGPLYLVGAGLFLLALGALLDMIWHTAFGLDETRWSTPHAMLGWGWGLAAFGFVSARLALREQQPVRWWTRAFLGLVLLSFSIGPILGPFQHNQIPAKVEAIAAIPILANQDEYQHTAQIYLAWELVRAHPLFVVLGAFWVGLSLLLLRALDHRLTWVVGVAVFWTTTVLLRDRSTAARLGISGEGLSGWLPVPLLPAALTSGLLWRLRYGEVAAAAVGGVVFGAVSQVVWPTVGPLVGAAIGAPFAALGALAGAQLGLVLIHPSQRGCTILTIIALVAPFVRGVADLYLRFHTP
jgi:hypothetical protein